MCHHLQVLSERSSRRFIARCEHGTYHLGWEGAVWLLNAAEVERLYSFLRAAESSEVLMQAPLSCVRHPTGHASVWFGARGLSLQQEDWPDLLELLEAGNRRTTSAEARQGIRLSLPN